MVVSVASGKGGTGKTIFSVSLFSKLKKENQNVLLVDLDVEEPNCNCFLNEKNINSNKAYMTFPNIDNEKCNQCKYCVSICNFNAIVVLPQKIYISKNLCHSCGRCLMNCMQKAIIEEEYEIGTINYTNNSKNETIFVSGTLKEGGIQSKKLISDVKKFAYNDENRNKKLIIQDCPPGVSCNMTEAVKDSNIVILVTEPTPFGLHDLKLAFETVVKLKIEFFVLINKSDENDSIIEDFCEKENIRIIGKIPYSEEVSSLYAEGKSSLSIDWYDDIIDRISKKLFGRIIEV